jgi:hypothetical protein
MFFFSIIVKISKTGFSSPWLAIGFLWVIFFFGYTISLGVFGVSSLVLGFHDANTIKEKIKLKET